MKTRDKTKTNADAGNKSLEYPERKPKLLSMWFVPTLLLCALIIISLTVLWLIQKNIDTSKQNQLVNNVESTAESIRLRLKGNQDYLLMLASDRAEGVLNSQSFQERASQYVADHPEMICINWVDATYTITDVAPIVPNKQIIGLRLKLPEPKRASRLAMKTRQPVYTRPFVVIQGDLAYELWVPVFHDGVFLGLFGGIYSYEKTLRSLVSPQVLKTNNVSLVDVSGKVLLEMPPARTVDEKLVHSTPLILPGNGALLQFKGYGPGVLERSLFLLGILCLVFAFGIAYAMWRLKHENEASKKAQEELRNADEYIQQLISSANVMIVGLDSNGSVRMLNKAAEKITGYTIDEILDIKWFETIVPQDRYAYVWETFENYQQKTGAMPMTFENPILTKSGEERLISWQNSTISTQGAKISTISFGIDITERKRAEEALQRLNRELRAISSCNQTLLRAVDEQILLNEICRIVCDEAGYRMAWVGYADHDEAKTIRPVAWAGFDKGYIADARLSWADDTERGRGPAGKVIRSGEIIYFQDVTTDPQMAPWRESALQHGYRSGIALPLKDESAKVFGVFMIYSTEANAVTPDEIRLLEELAGDMAFGITTLRIRTKRKRTEKALRINEERYRKAEAIGHAGNWEYNLQTTKFWGSDEAKRIYGFDPEALDFSTDEVENCIPERERAHQALVDLIEKDKPYKLEFEIHPKNSLNPRIISSIAELKRDDQGNPMLVTGIIQDITDNKRAEAALVRAKEEWERTFDATPDLIALIDVDHRIVRANRAMTERLGCTPEQAAGLLCWEAVHGLQAPPDSCPLSRMVASGKEERSEITEPRLGGVFDVSATPLCDKAGQLIGSVHVARDITERKRAEAALQFRNVLLSNQQEASIDGILVVDENAHILLNNRRFVEMWNIPPDLVEKKDDEPVLRFVTGKVADSRTFLQRVQYLYEHRKEAGWDKIILKDGRTFDRYSASMFGPDDQYYGRVWYFRDITEKLSLESQFQQAQKMESIGRLAGGVAHDFNNMLGVIIGHAEMVLNKMDPSQPFFNDLQEIRKAAEHSANLTRQLLAFARKQIIAPKVLDLNETVEGILKILRRLMGEDIDLAWLPETGMWMVKMDPSQIDQILANLCVNARDAIAGVGKVTIETRIVTFDETYCAEHPGVVPGNYVMLAINDNGCGMDKEIQDKIFEPFFTTKELGKGTGLGLATVYGIVKQNNGFINVYSEPGYGTSFKIYLPRHVAEAGEINKESLIVQTARGYETILLVEDELSILNMIKQMLGELGYQILSASTPDEAILAAKNHPGKIHLLVTDVVMPGMNGRDLAKKLVSIYPGIKSLFMSGYSGVAIADHVIMDEAVNFIQKPFSRHAFAAKIRETLDGK